MVFWASCNFEPLTNQHSQRFTPRMLMSREYMGEARILISNACGNK